MTDASPTSAAEAAERFRRAETLASQGDLGKATQLLLQAAELDPSHRACRTKLGILFLVMGFPELAIHWHHEALILEPRSLLLHINHACVLPILPCSRAEIEQYHSRLRRCLEEIPADLDPPTASHGIEINPHLFFLAFHDDNIRDPIERYARLLSQHFGQVNQDHEKNSEKQYKIRIGFLSAFFSQHSNLLAFEGLIRNLDRTLFEVILIHIHDSTKDSERDQLDACCDQAIVLPADYIAATSSLAGLGLDLLFITDIGMHPLSAMLATRKYAPVQVTGWGTPHTSGLASIDYYISGDLVEPEDAKDHYSEKLVKLPGLPCCYLPERLMMPELGREYFWLPPDVLLVGCLQSFHKLHPDFDHALEQIAQQVPEVLFVFIEADTTSLSSKFMERLARNAPSALSRLVMLGRTNREEYMALTGNLDLILDTFHYGSGITVFETLHTGTPIVTMEGRFLRSRFVAGAYRAMGLVDAPVAQSPTEFVEIVVRLLRQPEDRIALRKDIRRKASVHLYNRLDYVRGFERFALDACSASGSAPIAKPH